MSGPQDSTAPQTPSLIRQTLSHRAISFLTGRYLPLSLAALAMLLASPALWAGWLMDDHFHRLRIMGSSYFPDCYGASWDLFRFFDGDPARTHRMMDAGMLPWWTYEKVQAGFWRPLTVLTHWIDYSLWPGSPALMHAQSLLWLGGLVGVTVALYRRILGVTAIAGLAALLFALDDAHALPVGFLANRNALPCALFGVLSLIAHDRWRRDGWRWGGLWGPLLFVLSLLAKEAGVSVLAYLVAYALFLDRAAVSRRFVALLPYAVLLIVWRMLWSWQGYGVHGLGLYIDPLAEPLRFVSAIIDHAPFLLLGQWALPPAEIAITLENGALEAMWYATCVSLAFISLVVVPVLRVDRVARFWAVGMLFSVIPVCATFPCDRLLCFVGIGAFGLLAQVLFAIFGRDRCEGAGGVRRTLTVSMGVMFLAVHIFLAPLLLSVRARFPTGPPSFLEPLYPTFPLDRIVEQQDVIIVNPPSPFHAIYVPVMRELNGQPVPRHTRVLAPGYSAMEVYRPDDRTLVIRPDLGFFSWKFDELFRGPQVPMHLGQRVVLTGMSVEVTAMTPDGRPREATFRFDVPLEDASLRWIYWKEDAFLPFELPLIGARVTLPSGI